MKLFEITHTIRIIGNDKIIECEHETDLVSYGNTIGINEDENIELTNAKEIMYNSLPLEVKQNYTL